MKLPLLASLATLMYLEAPAAAQQLAAPLPAAFVRTMPAPRAETLVPRAIYDVQQDRIREVRYERWDSLALGSAPCFDNSELAGGDETNNHWVTPYPGEELVSWGFKNCRESGLVSRITIGFGSNAGLGGTPPGGALNLAMYQGTTGFGDLGTEVFRRTITGLPTNHGHTPVLLTIDFGTQPLRLLDGNIGWGFLQLDGLTGPFLVRAPRTTLGTADAMDLYSIGPAPLSDYRGTFNYGGCSAPFYSLCASQWMQIEEVPADQVAGAVVRNGTGANPLLLFETQPARLGQLWAASLIQLDRFGFPHPTALFLSHAPAGPQASPFGELLIDYSRLMSPPLLGRGAYTALIPADTALAGRRIHLQGAILDPAGSYLTNALRSTVGY